MAGDHKFHGGRNDVFSRDKKGNKPGPCALDAILIAMHHEHLPLPRSVYIAFGLRSSHPGCFEQGIHALLPINTCQFFSGRIDASTLVTKRPGYGLKGIAYLPVEGSFRDIVHDGPGKSLPKPKTYFKDRPVRGIDPAPAVTMNYP